jgi:hypothetical protein
MRRRKDTDKTVEWRQSKILELMSMGYSNQTQLAQIMHVPLSTVNRDILYLRQKAQDNIQELMDKKLPEEFNLGLVGLEGILREAWNTSRNTEDRREKIAALSLAKDVYSMRLDLVTNADVISSVMKFIGAYKSNKSENGNNNNSNTNKIDNNSEVVHSANASSDIVVSSTTDKVF